MDKECFERTWLRESKNKMNIITHTAERFEVNVSKSTVKLYKPVT